VIRSATFSCPTRKYTYDQHVAKFEDAYNELALLGDPVPKQSKVRLFCKSLKEKFMKAVAIDTQMSEKTGLNFEQAAAHLKSVRDLHITDFAKKGEERYVAELGLEPHKHKGGGGGP
jgi:pyruvate/2-oxoglutarate/acetoin dehydrogenase E1 component